MKKFKSIIIVFLILVLIAGSLSYGLDALSNRRAKNNYYSFKNTTFSQEEYSVFYALYINEFINEYAMYLSSWGLDVNKDFSLQQYDDEHTWEEALLTNMENDLEQFIILNEDMKKTKNKIDVDNDVEQMLEIFKSNANYAGMEYEEYLHSIFGTNVTEKDVKSALKYKYNAIEYSNVLYNKFLEEPTEKELIALYTQYPATFDKVLYRCVTFDKTEHDKAHELGDNITTEDSFIELAKNYTNEDTLFADVGTQDLEEDEIISWLYDDNRKKGDTTIIETKEHFYVMFFKSRTLCDDPTANFKHIYFNTIGANKDEYNEIKSKATAVYSSIQNATDLKTEFNNDALLYSDDSLTKLKGGKIENARKNSVDNEINNWLFSNRKENDITMIETSAGFYILCFDSYGDVYWKTFARQYLAEEKYNEYISNLMKE